MSKFALENFLTTREAAIELSRSVSWVCYTIKKNNLYHTTSDRHRNQYGSTTLIGESTLNKLFELRDAPNGRNKPMSANAKEKARIKLKGRIVTWGDKISKALKGREFPGDRQQLSITITNLWQDENYQNKQKESHKANPTKYWLGKHLPDYMRQEISQTKKGREPVNKGMKMSPEFGQKISRVWERPEYIAKQAKSRNIKPNNSELRLQSILNMYFPGMWIYTADKKRADFENISGESCILMHGIYWHLWRFGYNDDDKERVELEDINSYLKLGYNKCLVIWEDELNDEKPVIEKVRRFINE